MGVKVISDGRKTRRRLLGVVAVVAAVAGGLVITTGVVEAAVVKSFTARFRTNDTGDIIFASNTLVTCAASTACTTAQANQTQSNNDFNAQYVDTDSVAATLNSSSASLTVPTGATVLWAGLYWGGSATNTDTGRASIRLARPGQAYTSLTGDVTTGKVATLGGYPYSGFVDVTSLVQTSGSYTVGGLTTTLGVNARGGWSIIAVIRDPTQPLRNLSVFDGYAEINSSESTVATTVSGFLTPSVGTVNARIGAVVSEGDAGLTGDAFKFNTTTLSDALNPASNFFNSSITRLGTRVTAKTPDYVNQLGWDTDYLTAPTGAIGNGQTSATATFTTGGESYEPIALFTAIDIFEPNVAVTKTGTKVGPGTALNPGDQIDYAITLSSTGSESAATTAVIDGVPAGTTYVPGTMSIDGTAVTDATDLDRAEYNTTTRQLTYRVGTGATALVGGTVVPGTSTTVRLRVAVNNPSVVGATISNQATVTYRSPTTGTTYTSLSDDPTVAGALNPTVFDVNDAPVATAVTQTIPEDTSASIALTAATSDPDGDALTYVVTQPASGTGTVSCTAGACTYTPPANYNGAAAFTYTATDPGGRSASSTVTITVSPVNDPPVAVNDALTTLEDTAATVNVIANDSDIDGGALSVSAFTQGTRGTVTCAGTSCTYTPNPNANGSDSFTYVVSDGNGGSATATVLVTITPVNDAPTATGGTFTTKEDTATSIDVLDGDADVDGQTVRLRSFTQAVHGTVTCAALTGPCTYTPVANYNGPDAFTYTIDDGPGGLTATATINLNVLAVNDLPVAVTDAAATAEDTPATILVLANDTDIDGDTLRVPSYTQPAHGVVTCVAATGSCTYSPALNYNGTDTFTYEVNDGNGGQSTGRVNLTVTAVNDAPVAVNDATATDEDAAVTIAVLGNDSDVDGDTLNVRTVTVGPTNGTVICTTSTCTYRPNNNFGGTDQFTYQIADRTTGGLTATAVVTITVNAVDDAPVAVADTVAATEDTTTAAFNVLTNDTDVDDATSTLRLTATTPAAHGTATCAASGSCTYRAAANYNGPDSFSYTVTDPDGATSSAIVTINVAAVNDAPQALDDSATTTEDTAVTVDVSAGDVDVDGDALTYAVATPPVNGTATCQPNGSCTYTPGLNFNGADSFTYRVSDPSGASAVATVRITVGAVNDPPVAVNDAATTAEDTSVAIDVLAGDTDPDGDTVQISAVGTPANGTVSCGTLPGSGPCTYAPRPNFNGTDTFTYSIVDPTGAGSTATVTVTVTAVNDPPVAGDDGVTTAEDTAVSFAIGANDSDVDGDPLTYAIVGAPPVGVACTTAGACTYSPPANANGTVSFDYTVDDAHGGTDTGTVTITVMPVNDPPTATSPTLTVNEDIALPIDLIAGAADIDGDALTISALSTVANGAVTCGPLPGVGPCTFTPNPNFNGPTSFTYLVSDGHGGSATGTVTIDVNPVNDPPVADPDSAVTDEDTPVVVDVLDGDTDIDGNVLTISAFTQPADGTAVCSFAVGGTCTYTPAANFNGTDTFTYTITDGQGGTVTALVSIAVRSANDAPLGVADVAIVSEDGTVDIPLTTNDTDVDGDALAIVGATQGAHGTVDCTISAGSCRYTPAPNFNGTDTFSYTISDGEGASATATVTVTVTPQNDAPQGVPRSVATREDTPSGAFDVVGGATDIDGDTITLVAHTDPPPAEGTVTCDNAAGTCTFTPALNFNGTSSFTVTISDGTTTDTETVTVLVTPVNDAPAAVADAATTNEDTPLTIAAATLLANDTDLDGDALTITTVTKATAHGSVSCSATGCTYTPVLNYNGTDSFTYDVTDPTGAQSTATVAVTINAVNDPPTPGDGVGVTQEDVPLSVPVSYVLANDTDPDMYDAVNPDTIQAISFSQPIGGGSVSCTGTSPYQPTDICTFTPALNSDAPVTFTYTVRDRGGLTATATITVLISPDNDAPTPADDALTTDEDTAATITATTLLGNDTDPDPGDVLSLVAIPQRLTAHGTVTCSTSGCTYAPSLNYHGPDSFTYEVSDALGVRTTATVAVAVTSVNDAPTPQPGAGTTPEDTPLSVPVAFVLSNDTDPDGDPLEAIAFSQPTDGGGTVSCPGTSPYAPSVICTFTPTPNFNGTSTFTYTVRDPGGLTASTVVTVFVTPVNDAPIAADDVAGAVEDTPLTIAAADLLGNDTDVDIGTVLSIVASTSATTNGSVACTATGCTYTPAVNFNGIDTFTYSIDDGDGGTSSATVTVSVGAVNDDPRTPGFAIETDEDTVSTVNVLAGASDPDDTAFTAVVESQPTHGVVTCSNAGLCTYTPDPLFNGTDSFGYRVLDANGGSAVGTVDVTVNPINDLPVAVTDARTIAEDASPLTVLVLGNDTDPDGDQLTVVGAGTGNLGSLACTVTECVYTPLPNAFGVDTITYAVSDGNGGTATGTVVVTITSVNDPPEAPALDISATEDTAVTVDLLAGTSDVDGDTLTATVIGAPSIGALACTPAGSANCVFTPPADFAGVVTITVEIVDGNGGTVQRTLTITVNPVNDPPLTAVTSGATNEDVPLSIDVLAGATDADPGDTVTFVAASPSANGGTVTCTPAGLCTYTPRLDFNGTDTFTYTIVDGSGAQVITTVTVAVAAGNDPPTAVPVAAAVDEDDPAGAAVDPLAAVSDVDSVAFTIVGPLPVPAHGSFTCAAAAGPCTYVPDANFHGTDTFVVTVDDGSGGTVGVAVTVTVGSVNDLPVATADAFTFAEDAGAVALDLLGNDTDADGDPLTIATVTQPANGIVTCTPGGCTYTPNANFNGTDTFTYVVTDEATPIPGTATGTVTITIAAVNDAPVAPTLTDVTNEDTPVSIDLLAGATDADGDALTVSAAAPSSGTLVCTPVGGSLCTFTPAADQTGDVTVELTISDGTTTTSVTRTIRVDPVNDPPVAVVTAATVVEDTSQAIDVLAGSTDADPGDTVTLVGSTAPAHGTLACDLGTGVCTYSPALDYNGADAFTYTLTDTAGATVTTTVSIIVTGVNDAPTPGSGSGATSEDTPLTVPVAYVLANDTDPDPGDTFRAVSFTQPAHGTVTCTGTSPYLLSDLCTYRPAPNFSGNDSFTYNVRDAAGLEGTATITVIVTPVNDPPTVADDDATVAEDTPITVDVLGNDSDIEGDPFAISAITQPQFGTVDCGPLPGPGGCTYTPGPNFNGTDSFTYQVIDQPAGGNGASGSATVNITVTPVDDPPQAPDRGLSTLEDLPLAFSALAGASDPEGTTISFVAVTQPANGTVSCDPAGACSYAPGAEFNGVVTFQLTVSDATGLQTTSTITVTVEPVNDPPVGGPDTVTIDEDAPATALDVLANDNDPEGAGLTVVVATAPVLGTVVCTPSGRCDYTPNTNVSGTDRFSYTLSDGVLQTSVTVTVTINPVPDAPIVRDDAATTNEDAEVVIPVLANDEDPDGGVPGNVTLVSPPATGTVRINNDTGAIGFTPAPNTSGVVSFVYSACGQSGECASATVTITVVPVPDDPVAEDASAVTNPGVAVTIELAAVTSDPDGDLDAASFALASAASHGTASADPTTRRIVYTSAPGYLGPDLFTYTICDGRAVCATGTVLVNVIAPLLPPTAVDDAATTEPSTPVQIPVLANDSVPIGSGSGRLDPASITTGAPAHGAVIADPLTGTITYTPVAGFTGIDNVTYTICAAAGAPDGEGTPLPSPPPCAAANVVVSVLAPPPPTTTPPPTAPPTAPPTTQPPVPPTAPPSTPTGGTGSIPVTGADIGALCGIATLLIGIGLITRRTARRAR